MRILVLHGAARAALVLLHAVTLLYMACGEDTPAAEVSP